MIKKFSSPTLKKELDEDLSILNEKSIVLPLGEVKVSRSVKSILIIVRMNTEIEIWDQNKKRLFEQPKVEYSYRSIKSLINSINFCQSKYPQIEIKTIIIDDNSKDKNLNRIKKLINNQNIEIISLVHDNYKNLIKEQKSKETFSNLASLMNSFEIGKNQGDDLVFFVEDDYLHFEPMLEEMVASYERISSQLKKDIFMCPSDYPYLYMNNEKTNILIGNKRHWRTINKTLCTFMTSKNLIDKYWENSKKLAKIVMIHLRQILMKFMIKKFASHPSKAYLFI